MGAYHLKEKSSWGVESIRLSHFYQFTAESPHLLRFESKKGVNLCSVSLEPRRNQEIGKW